ncbi:unnamed protein product [Mycena citricolor]|uniref:Glycoside hydrolase family 125 protein n=1 Tax=Mycena citricolor TaxID=2018698 RepID=A0AAD2JV03_9AGAR|nr:unnamed protein product [Mycena citricolor]
MMVGQALFRLGMAWMGLNSTWSPLRDRPVSSCPDYTTYSASAQGNPSNGVLGLPYMRPAPACRTFNSTSVERVIEDMNLLLRDPDLARLFENTFANTLDTTVKYFNKSENIAFIITGVIMPIPPTPRISSTIPGYHCSVVERHGQPDDDLAALVRAVINTEAGFISQFPYCRGAFQPPTQTGLSPSHNDWADHVVVNPPIDDNVVFECKYELDSLAGFLKLSRQYYEGTRDSTFMDEEWFSAIEAIFRVIEEQSRATFDEDGKLVSFYNWTGTAGSLSPRVPNGGNGEPKGYNGMVGTHHRPSDDLSTFAFLTPANAMLSVELDGLAHMLNSVALRPDLSSTAKLVAGRIRDSIWSRTVVDGIFAYESNGLGSVYMMDDANVPSLLSLPYLGFVDKHDPTYRSTRRFLLSRQNPYFASGSNFSGIGGPHSDAWHPWPMSLISGIFGTNDDQEISEMLYLIANNTAGLGLIHESQSIYDQSDYTRSWFAWANSYFAEMILDLAHRKPQLILKGNGPYMPSQIC